MTRAKPSQTGMAMVEALVASAVLGVGMLGGGDKRTQASEIERAKARSTGWDDARGR